MLKRNLILSNSLFPYTSTPQASSALNLLSVSADWPVLDFSYKGNDRVCGLLWLVSLTYYNVFMFYPCHVVSLYFIPFHGWTVFHHTDDHHLVDIWVVDAFLTVMKNVAVNVCVQDSVWTWVSYLLSIIPLSGISGSNGNSTFSFLQNYQSVLQSSWIILHFQQQYIKVSVSSHPYQHLSLCL